MAASKACLSRLQKEYQRLSKEPLPDILAEPKCVPRRSSRPARAPTRARGSLGRPNNILEWHFVIKGPKDTPYYNGHYHGKLIFPAEYPYKPPAIMMLTPKCVQLRTTGVPARARGARMRHSVHVRRTAHPRLSPQRVDRSGRFNTNTRLCLSMSDFHPETCGAHSLSHCPCARTVPRATPPPPPPVRPSVRPSALAAPPSAMASAVASCRAALCRASRSWVPAWSVASILNGVLSFMLEVSPT
jgi:ubiquitin-protein ligase